MCSRVAILKQGRLVAVDTPDELARRVAQAGRLVVRVDGPPAEVEATLARLPGVSAVERARGDAGSSALFHVVLLDPAPAQRVLASTIVERGWTLLEVRAETPTLEELFVRLVG